MDLKSCSLAPQRVLSALAARGMFNWMPDEVYLKIQYRTRMNKRLNLENPQTFNEKLQWLKLHDRRPEYTMMVDKYRVREFIGRKLGEEYLIPLIAVWDDPEEIDFDMLPDRFVLKCNHNSGLGMCICKDKSELDVKKVKAELRRGLRQDYYKTGREWPYKDVPRKIICEQYMEDAETGELRDYKFMCFSGRVECCFVCSERNTDKGLHVTFYDRKWNKIPFERRYPNAEYQIKMPKNYLQMIEFAEKLSEGIPFLRVDFYEVDGTIYFGEMTFYPGSGYEEFTPSNWDKFYGDMLVLPNEQ